MAMDISFPGGVAVSARLGEITIRTDQPSAAGGTGTDPSPFDLFLASIGTCAGYYAVRFCRERQIPTEGLSLRMDWERDPESKLVSRISVAMTLPPGFPEKYRDAIVRAADQCTVKKHLAAPPAIVVTADALAASPA